MVARRPATPCLARQPFETQTTNGTSAAATLDPAEQGEAGSLDSVASGLGASNGHIEYEMHPRKPWKFLRRGPAPAAKSGAARARGIKRRADIGPGSP